MRYQAVATTLLVLCYGAAAVVVKRRGVTFRVDKYIFANEFAAEKKK